MPVLENPKHERFVQELAKGKSASEAYRNAGYDAEGNSADAAASRLLKKVKVAARLAEIQERVAKRVEITVESLIQEAAEIQAAAMVAGQHSAAVSALTAKAKIAGKWIERKEVGEPGDFDGMGLDELREHLRDEAAALGEGDIAAALAGGGGTTTGKPH